MNRLQRYLLRDLLTAFVLILLIVTGVFFAGMVLQAIHRTEGLGLQAVFRALPFLLPIALPVTAPLALLMACLLTYGRFSDDNEFLAMRMGGIHPWHAVAPAIACGAILSIGTLYLNTELIPAATFGKKIVFRDQIGRLARAVQSGDATQLSLGKNFKISWDGRDGPWLVNMLITYVPKDADDAEDEAQTRIALRSVEAARGRLNVSSTTLHLILEDARIEDLSAKDNGVTRYADRRKELSLPLGWVMGTSPLEKPKGSDEMRADEIYYRIQRSSEDRIERKYRAVFWERVALGLAPLAFSMLGAPLGLSSARGSRMAAMTTALLVALPVYYPLLLWGENLARDGVLPAPAALMIGNALMMLAGIVLLVKTVRV